MMIKKLGNKIFLLFIFFPVVLLSEIIFTQKVSKTDIFINETIKVTLTLKVDNSDNIDQVYFEDYETSDFWYKKHEDKKVIEKQNYKTYIYTYLLDAKKIGTFTLPKQLIEVSNNQIRAFRRWQKIYSNEVKIDVKPTIEDLAIQGNFEISANVDKTNINENDSIKLSIDLKGSGNIKDIKPFELKLDNQVVYDNKPIINQEFKETKYFGNFKQEFLVIANESFTIKPFTFTYYNMKNKRVEKISTQAIFIDVDMLKKTSSDEPWIKYLFLLIGLLLGVGLTIIYVNYRRKKSKQELPLVKKINKCKNDNELYKVLIAYSNEYEFKEAISKLEENIYKNAKNKIKKKEILEEVINKN